MRLLGLIALGCVLKMKHLQSFILKFKGRVILLLDYLDLKFGKLPVLFYILQNTVYYNVEIILTGLLTLPAIPSQMQLLDGIQIKRIRIPLVIWISLDK